MTKDTVRMTFLTPEALPNQEELQAALQAISPEATWDGATLVSPPWDVALRRLADGEAEFSSLRQAFERELSTLDGDRRSVTALLKQATSMVVADLPVDHPDPDEALDALDPVWEVLFGLCGGLLRVDDEGWYDEEDIIASLPDGPA